MTDSQVIDLARPLLGMIDTIFAYYQDPEHEREFQTWYRERYGKAAPEGA